MSDCADGDPTAHLLPSEAIDLRLDAAGLMLWDPPLDPGGTLVWYDTLRAPDPFSFPVANCLEIDDLDLTSPSGGAPPSGVTWYYLVRAGNGCGDGSLGYDYPAGIERLGRACP